MDCRECELIQVIEELRLINRLQEERIVELNKYLKEYENLLRSRKKARIVHLNIKR